jgi:hypothetical protein
MFRKQSVNASLSKRGVQNQAESCPEITDCLWFISFGFHLGNEPLYIRCPDLPKFIQAEKPFESSSLPTHCCCLCGRLRRRYHERIEAEGGTKKKTPYGPFQYNLSKKTNRTTSGKKTKAVVYQTALKTLKSAEDQQVWGSQPAVTE